MAYCDCDNVRGPRKVSRTEADLFQRCSRSRMELPSPCLLRDHVPRSSCWPRGQCGPCDASCTLWRHSCPDCVSSLQQPGNRLNNRLKYEGNTVADNDSDSWGDGSLSLDHGRTVVCSGVLVLCPHTTVHGLMSGCQPQVPSVQWIRGQVQRRWSLVLSEEILFLTHSRLFVHPKNFCDFFQIFC